MQLNEHLSKVLFVEAGIATPQGFLCKPADIGAIWPDFHPPWVLKAQVLAGGRGKAGGVRIVDTKESFVREAREILDLTIKGKSVPPASGGAEGRHCQRILSLLHCGPKPRAHGPYGERQRRSRCGIRCRQIQDQHPERGHRERSRSQPDPDRFFSSGTEQGTLCRFCQACDHALQGGAGLRPAAGRDKPPGADHGRPMAGSGRQGGDRRQRARHAPRAGPLLRTAARLSRGNRVTRSRAEFRYPWTDGSDFWPMARGLPWPPWTC